MSFNLDYAGATAPKRRRLKDHPGDDRVGYRPVGDLALFYLADGATGVGLGGMAADAFVDGMEEAEYNNVSMPQDCVRYLREIDEDVRVKVRGQADTTGIMVVSDGEKLWGASAGDSSAWLFGQVNTEITKKQRLSPRIGNGASPVAFGGYVKPGDIVVVGSDGLWQFLPLDVIESVARSPLASRAAVEKLEMLVRDRQGEGLDDDFGAVIVRF
jgi:serine/threonine protein phosphatase PrpC